MSNDDEELAKNQAFPVATMYSVYPGMQLRDYFAAKAMQALFSNSNIKLNVADETLAKCAYQVADAMLKEREKND